MRGCRRLLFAAIMGAAAVQAQQPPASTATPTQAAAPAPKPSSPPAQAQTPAQKPKAADEPDEGLIEFLGSDDVGDSGLWEFLKRAPPRAKQPPATPPQDVQK